MKKSNIIDWFSNLINNKNKNIKNNKTMQLDFVINGIYKSKLDDDTVIEVLGENEKIANAFDVKIISSKTYEWGKKLKFSEQQILDGFDFISEKSYKPMQGEKVENKFKLNIISSDNKNTKPTHKVEHINVLNTNETTAETTDESTTKTYDFVDMGDGVAQYKSVTKSQPKPIKTQTNFNDELVEKIITKNSNKPCTLNISLDTDLDIENILKAVNYIDLDLNDFMDILFKNESFKHALKVSLISSLVQGDYDNIIHDIIDKQPDEKSTEKPVEKSTELDDIKQSLSDIKTKVSLVQESLTEWSNLLQSSTEKNGLKLDDVIRKMDEEIIGEMFRFEQPIDMVEQPIIDIPIPPIFEQPIEQSNDPLFESNNQVIEHTKTIVEQPIESLPPINEPLFKGDYNSLIDQFISKNI